MPAGLSGFKDLLREFSGLSLTLLGGSAIVPFAAALLSLSPPWPPAIAGLTAIIELIALVFAYHFLRTSRRRTISVVLVSSFVLLCAFSLIYLAADSLFTHTEGPLRLVKGLECTAEARLVYGQKCPFLGGDELKAATFEVERLWTAPSIMLVRVGLVVLWLASFLALSTFLGAFLVFQMKARNGRGGEGKVAA